ncbi:MAG TPA: glycosyltransferase family 2 protein, partial [Opitutaceae bacterium]|nr:glycosyltransferase family 2 protein [Opitutaceae bacterium]
MGRSLEQLWERAQAFADACPDIACRPLFYHRAGEWDYLAEEFFKGREVEVLVREGRQTVTEVVACVEKIMAALERTQQPSTPEAAAQELDWLFTRVCALPLFARFDQTLLQEAVFPFVRAGMLAGPFRTRWTNGDLIPRNVLVDPHGNVRLIDYEFAARTHFFAEDAWRWRIFSTLPPEARELPGLGDITNQPWVEAFHLLRQIVLAHEVNGAQRAASDSRPALDRLAGLAATQTEHQNSVFLQRLAAIPAVEMRLAAELEKHFSLIAKLEESGRAKDTVNAHMLNLSRAVVGDALQEIIRLRDLLYQREEKIRHMQQSISWQATTPLRAARRRLLDRYRSRQPVSADPARMPAINFYHSPRDFDDISPMLRFGIDHPYSWDTVAGAIQVKGWCFAADKIGIKNIRARVGHEVYPGTYGQPRPDIAGQHPQYPQAQHCGFTIDLVLDPSNRHLVIEAGDEHGKWQRLLTERPGRHISDDYARWVRDFDTLTSAAVDSIYSRLQTLPHRPLISVVMPVFNPPGKWLLRAIESVRTQIYEPWELCIADDASTAPHVRPLLEKAAHDDHRIKVVFREANGHISAASNSALALAGGEFVALLDHDDELRPHALACVAFELDRFPKADLVYSDEDKLNENGFRFGPYFKPDWNPDLFLAQNFICHLAVYRASILREIGGFRTGYEGAQDWDLAMRVVERSAPDRIRHIPRILYHWRAISGSTAMHIDQKTYSVTAAERLLRDHFSRINVKAELTPVPGDYWRVRYALPRPAPRVTLIIPTRNRLNVLRPCIVSILEKTAYPNYEILVVDNDSDESETRVYLEELRRHPRCRVIAFAGPFNFSALNNFAVRQTDAPLVGLLNNDLEVIQGDWLDEMAGQALRPEIGCVGAKLYYPDGRIQHAGVILGLGRVAAGHAWHGHPRQVTGPGYRAVLQQNLSAVTAACLVLRREVYLQAGGFDEENFKVALNDVDFCLKVRAAGYRNLYTPFAELYHHE